MARPQWARELLLADIAYQTAACDRQEALGVAESTIGGWFSHRGVSPVSACAPQVVIVKDSRQGQGHGGAPERGLAPGQAIAALNEAVRRLEAWSAST